MSVFHRPSPRLLSLSDVPFRDVLDDTYKGGKIIKRERCADASFLQTLPWSLIAEQHGSSRGQCLVNNMAEILAPGREQEDVVPRESCYYLVWCHDPAIRNFDVFGK